MIRMLLVGYCYSIRSERRLREEVELNLAYRWFCRLGLEDKVPDHSTFSDNRHGRFRKSDILRTVFEEVVCACMATGLVGGEGFAVDASVIEANASRFQRVEGAEVDWTPEQRAKRPVEEYLLALESENPPINPDQPPRAMSPSDPAAAWTTRGRHKVMFGYSLNYPIDMEAPIIVDVEATPTRTSKEVDAMVLLAADRTPNLLRDPSPFVLQTELEDFCINYELNVYCDQANEMPRLYALSHQNFLDVFNEHEVPIMTPAYVNDTAEPKMVRKDNWFAAPAESLRPLRLVPTKKDDKKNGSNKVRHVSSKDHQNVDIPTRKISESDPTDA